MSHPIYYVPAGDVLPIMFSTYAGATGASVTMTGLAVTDIEIYKDGGTTQRASDAGYTLLDTDGIDFDGITGIHGFSIDTGDNTDSGFYTVGAWFHVVVSAVTVDSQTVNFIAASFRLMPAEGIAGHPKVDVGGWLGTAVATPTVAGVPQVDPTHWNGTAVAIPDTAGYPKVTVKSGTGTGEISLTSGRAKIQAALQINTALTDFAFQMTDSTNHNPLAGLGDADVVVSYSHDGGETFTSLGFAAEGTGGTYYKTITTTAMNAARVLLKMVGTGADTLYILLETAP